MKTEMRWRTMLATVMIAALSAVAISCSDDDDKNNNPKPMANYTISGNANGNQVVPSVDGTGTGTISGTYNPNTRTFNYTNNWSGLTGAPTGGGFYNGATGVNGAAVGMPWTYDGTTTSTGTYSGTMMLTQAQEQQLLAGNWYYGYNTATNTTGEVRGQISAVRQAQ